MLHALLRRKLHPLRPEPERLEDALTSTIMGPLLWTEAWGVLGRWLNVDVPPTSDVDYWFWPRLELAEPDVIVRLGANLVVIEAKFASGRHDGNSPDSEDALSDQIARQYASITKARGTRIAYSPALERAIDRCTLVQVMAVDSRRLRRARREFKESLAELPHGAHLRLVTWQQLYSLLATSAVSDRPMTLDLLAYMEMAGLDSFNGIGQYCNADSIAAGLLQWRAAGRRDPTLRSTVAVVDPIAVSRLREWRGPREVGNREILKSTQFAKNAFLSLTLLQWRRSNGGN